MREGERRLELAARWSGKIRGVFEMLWGGDRGWMLAWTAEDPPAAPRVLVDGVTSLRWEVLMPPPPLDAGAGASLVELTQRDRGPAVWEEVHAAYLEQDFPDAVRVIFETDNGTRADWLFETSVVTPGRGD
jgi:hypothetical protein